MQPIRTFSLFMLFLLLVFLLMACGDTNSAQSNATPTATTGDTRANPSPTSNEYGNPTPTPTSASTSGSLVIKTATRVADGQSQTYLTNAQGLTLYYDVSDTNTTSSCTGGCAGTWPPLLATGSTTPTSDTALPGTLSVVSSGNGTQVQYDGHFLYTYSGDTAPGQTNGKGLQRKWFIAASTI